MEKINVAGLLKNCPKGMELDCTMCDEVVLVGVDNSLILPIKIRCKDVCLFALTKYGQCCDSDYAKCVIFPKGKTTWDGFVPPCQFKDGDVLFVDCSDDEDKSYQYIFILNKSELYGKWHSYCHLDGVGYFHSKETYLTDDEYNPRFATEEEKQKLFDAIKAHGYKWNPETKTLEKLAEPQFKVGDTIKHKTHISKEVVVTEIKDTHYILNDESALPFTFQDEYEVVPNKFNINTLVPFESKVLVRNDEGQYWIPAFWGCKRADGYTTTFGWCKYCIPFEGNEHLLGTNDDCDEYFKTWK